MLDSARYVMTLMLQGKNDERGARHDTEPQATEVRWFELNRQTSGPEARYLGPARRWNAYGQGQDKDNFCFEALGWATETRC